jgi:hypothetical protein
MVYCFYYYYYKIISSISICHLLFKTIFRCKFIRRHERLKITMNWKFGNGAFIAHIKALFGINLAQLRRTTKILVRIGWAVI